MKKILIMGALTDPHMGRLVHNVQQYNTNSDLQIDSYAHNTATTTFPFSHCFQSRRHFFHLFYKIRYVRGFCTILDYIISFLRIPYHYDLINIHFVTLSDVSLRPFLKFKGRKTMITPWGSDVLRVTDNQLPVIRRFYHSADIISCPPIRFREDVKRIMKVGEEKMVPLCFGSEIMDLLIDNNCSKEEAKRRLNLEGKFLITCGYNGNAAQHHREIVEALIQVKPYLPSNTLLVFPITYGCWDKEYIAQWKQRLDHSGLEYCCYESYMTNEAVANLRIASDIFIHIQKSDAYSATVQEFLFTDTVVFNGAWTRYPNLESPKVPYILVESIESLAKQLEHFFTGKINNMLPVSQETKAIIRKNAWKSRGKEWFDYYCAI